MTLQFPPDFIFGTSTSAYQIETAIDHDWQGIKAEDGFILGKTTDHELNWQSDVDIIASLAPSYRMSLMWSKLQQGPYAPLHSDAVRYYHQVLKALKDKDVSIMMVLHHFCNPNWFASAGGWTKSKNISVWQNYAQKVVDEFGFYVDSWNTFNEPNLYASMSYAVGKFPPFKSNMILADQVIKNMGKAHDLIFAYIKKKFPKAPVGISYNCAVFEGLNAAGKLASKFADYWYMDYLHKFFNKSDFIGLSYYARIPMDPAPITARYTLSKMKKLKREHDDIWEYYPEGLKICLQRFWSKNKKPIIITENGICSSDDTLRIRALKDYMKIIHELINQGVDIKGYYHWSTWDNFEWTLGPTFKFGLYDCDPLTMKRTKKPSADIFRKLAYQKNIDV